MGRVPARQGSSKFPPQIGISYPDHFGVDGVALSLEARLDLSKDEIKRILQESGLPTYLEMSDSERWWGEASTSGLYFHIIVASQTPQEDAKAVDAEIGALRSIANLDSMGITKPKLHYLLLEKKALNPLGRRIYNGEDTENGPVKGGYETVGITLDGIQFPQLLFLARNTSGEAPLTDGLRITILPSPAYVEAAKRYYQSKGVPAISYEPRALPRS